MGIHFVKSRDSPTSPDLAERSHVHGFLSVKVAHLSLKFLVSSRSDLILVADRSAKEAKSIGGFPKIGGVPLVIHLNRIFHCETSTYWGTPSMEIPICFFSSFSLGHRYQLQGCIITSSVPVLSSIMANLSAAIHTCMYIHKYIYIHMYILYIILYNIIIQQQLSLGKTNLRCSNDWSRYSDMILPAIPCHLFCVGQLLLQWGQLLTADGVVFLDCLGRRPYGSIMVCHHIPIIYK